MREKVRSLCCQLQDASLYVRGAKEYDKVVDQYTDQILALFPQLSVEEIEKAITEHLQEGIDHYYACHTQPEACACATIHCINMECGSARKFLAQALSQKFRGTDKAVCSFCNGTGKRIAHPFVGESCPLCKGTGKPLPNPAEEKPFNEYYGLEIAGKFIPFKDLPTDINELKDLIKKAEEKGKNIEKGIDMDRIFELGKNELLVKCEVTRHALIIVTDRAVYVHNLINKDGAVNSAGKKD